MAVNYSDILQTQLQTVAMIKVEKPPQQSHVRQLIVQDYSQKNHLLLQYKIPKLHKYVLHLM